MLHLPDASCVALVRPNRIFRVGVTTAHGQFQRLDPIILVQYRHCEVHVLYVKVHVMQICTRTQLRQWQLTNDSLQSQALESPAASLARVGIIESSSPFSDATTPGPPSTDDDDLKCSQVPLLLLCLCPTSDVSFTKDCLSPL